MLDIMLRLAAMLALALVAGAAPAQKVYKWVMPDGTIRYSDRPQEEGAVAGEEVRVPRLQTYTAPPVPSAAAGGGPAGLEEKDASFKGYDEFAIVAPADDEAIRDNAGNVSIRLSLKPGLDKDHVIEISIDGTSLGTGRTTTISMTNVDRGSHTVRATVRDKDGKQVATTDAVTFHIKRVAAGS